MDAVIAFAIRIALAGWLLLNSASSLAGEEDDKKSGEEVSQKLQPVGDQPKRRGKGVGKYLSLLSFTKWKPADFFELQHILDMCQSIADEDYKVIDAATKAQVNSQERYGMTILHWAFLTGDHVAFEKLLKRGADLHLKFTEDVKGDRVIFQKGSELMFTALYERGHGSKFFEIGMNYITEPNCRTLRENGNLIHEYIFVCGGRSSPRTRTVIKKLLEVGCDPNAQDSRGSTACMCAVGYFMPEDAMLMLDHNADPNIKNNKGEDLRAVVERMLKNGIPVPPNKMDLTEGYQRLAGRVGADVDFEALKAAKAAKE